MLSKCHCKWYWKYEREEATWHGVILPFVYTWKNPLQPWSESTWVNENCNGGGAMEQVKNHVPL